MFSLKNKTGRACPQIYFNAITIASAITTETQITNIYLRKDSNQKDANINISIDKKTHSNEPTFVINLKKLIKNW